MILVTGGAGFIGSHLVETLVQQHETDVVILDNFNDYYDSAIKEKNVLEIKNNLIKMNISPSRMEVIKGDIRDKSKLKQVFEKNKFDLVVHLAAMAGVRPSIEMPEYYYDVNINGTLNILEECKKNGVKKIIFASSSSVYGNNDKVPFSENDIVDFPISPYAATKKSGELLCHTYHHLYEINIACLRFFTVYGPRQRPDLAIHKFANLALENKSIPFYGDGSSERDYTYIDDIIDGIVKSMDWVKSSNVRFGVFNLGESETISLTRMVNTLQNEMNKVFCIERMPFQPGDVSRTFADINLAKKELGYNPKTSFEDGIRKFIEWKTRAVN